MGSVRWGVAAADRGVRFIGVVGVSGALKPWEGDSQECGEGTGMSLTCGCGDDCQFSCCVVGD